MISEQIGLDVLRTYVAICRQGSLSRVAEQTGRTQSALSMQIRRLEGLLGRHLFRRTGRGVVPTPEGEIFLGYATRILALGDEAVERLRQRSVSGEVRFGVPEEAATSMLRAALTRLRTYPDISLEVVVDHSIALGRLWNEAGLDIMIAPITVADTDAVTTWNVEMNWVGAEDYIPVRTQPLDLVVFPSPCPWRRRMIDALVAAGREYRISFTSQSITALQTAVESGLGVGLLPPEPVRTRRMQILKAGEGIPGPLTAQYGLYAHDQRSNVVDTVLDVLRNCLPDNL